MVDVTQEGAAGRDRGPRIGIHPHAAHAREVDDEPVVDAAQTAAVVAPAADGDVEALLASEPHRGDHVGDVAAPDDHRRVLVDHRVVQRASVVVVAVSGDEHVAANIAAERIHCRRVESHCGHDGPRSVIRPALHPDGPLLKARRDTDDKGSSRSPCPLPLRLDYCQWTS